MYQKIAIVLVNLMVINNVSASCNFSQVPNIQFSYPPNVQGIAYSTTTLGVTCTANENITATLSTGTSGSYTQRIMHSTNNSIYYNVYIDANFSQIFGDGSQATSIINTTCNGSCNSVLYSRTYETANLQAGTYSDTLIISINY